MKYPTLIMALLMLSACQSMQSDDPSSLSFRVPGGSTLALNKAIEIPSGQTHAMIQAGEPTTEGRSNQYEVGCRLNFRNFGPRTIEPEVFNIRRTAHREGWESRPNFYFYSSEIFLDSERGTDVISLECSTWAVPPSFNFTFADMQQTLGDYLTFDFRITESVNQRREQIVEQPLQY